MTKFCFRVTFFLSFCLVMALAADEDKAAKRIYSHLFLDDPTSALQEVKEQLNLYPESKILREIHVEVLAKMGDEKGMAQAWDTLVEKFPDEKNNRVLIENVAWGTLTNALRSTSPPTRLIGVLGAFFANDAKSVHILKKCLQDSSALIRAVAVQMVSNMRDTPLCDEMLNLFAKETNFAVRLEVIQALGKMKIMQSRCGLEAIVANTQSSAEEKAAAIHSIIALVDTMERSEMLKLVSSNRAGLRLLACEAVTHFDLHRDLDLIIPLLQDSNAEVRGAALRALGYLRVTCYQDKPIIHYVAPLENDHDYHVAISATWVMTLNDAIDGQNHFKHWLKHDLQDVRLFAAAALVAAGKHGMPLISESFYAADDPYVRMNLAFGLIAQRVDTQQACQALADGLNNIGENWMWGGEGTFQLLTPSTIRQSQVVTEHPRTVNQLVRLEVLNLLAIMKYPKTQEALKCFLREQTWGVTWMAGALMLTEGDDEAIVIVRNLLNDPDPVVRIQSALLLATWGRDEQAIAILEQAYKGADRECKGHILEGLAKIGSDNTIPFLMGVLKEPHHTFRIIAACAILQCLNS